MDKPSKLGVRARRIQKDERPGMTQKLACPKCQAFESVVINCRPDRLGIAFERWRRCKKCRARFLTEEKVVRRLPSTPKNSTNINI